MKYYLSVMLITFAALAAGDDEWKPLDKPAIQQIYDDCRKELGITRANRDKDDEHNLCVVLKMGIFSEDKGYNLDRTLAQNKAIMGEVEGAREIIAGCLDSNEEKSTAAEWARRGQQCIVKSKIGAVARERADAEN